MADEVVEAPVVTETPPAPPVEPPAEPPADKVEFSAEQQEVIDNLIKGVTKRYKTQAKIEIEAEQATAKEKADKAAHIKKLEDDKEFQKLIDEQKLSIGEITPALESAKEQLKVFGEMANNILTKRIEGLGEAAKTAVDNLPGEPDVLAKLNWLTANEELFKKPDIPARGTPPKNGVKSAAFQKKVDEVLAPTVNF